jgi:divalent metal cation (Fe/Co/Zn/Cd) transporter
MAQAKAVSSVLSTARLNSADGNSAMSTKVHCKTGTMAIAVAITAVTMTNPVARIRRKVSRKSSSSAHATASAGRYGR